MKIRLEHGLVGAMDYGFPADGILGLDYLLLTDALIDLRRRELRLLDIR
jgi:hypothetical protein